MIRTVCLSIWLGCAVSAAACADVVELNQTFQLRLGEHATLTGSRLRLLFDRVVQDSRCPRGEQCIVAGTATVRFLVGGPGEEQRTLELRLPDRASAPLPPAGPALLLLRLDPYPVSGRSTPPDRYMATVVIGAAGTDTER